MDADLLERLMPPVLCVFTLGYISFRRYISAEKEALPKGVQLHTNTSYIRPKHLKITPFDVTHVTLTCHAPLHLPPNV